MSWSLLSRNREVEHDQPPMRVARVKDVVTMNSVLYMVGR